MSRYIDAAQTAETISQRTEIPLADLVDIFAEIPTADVAEVKYGEWTETALDRYKKYQVQCSLCGIIYTSDYDQYIESCEFVYCPNCGAKMDGKEQGDE